MELSFPIKNNAHYAQWSFMKKAFTFDECNKVLEIFKNPIEAQVGNAKTPNRNHEARKSEIVWLSYNQETAWIFQLLMSHAIGCNQAYYNFDLAGFGEVLQIARYTEGGHYKWHQDIGVDELSKRKLSIVVQLSDFNEYEGGELEFLDCPEKAPKGKGDIIIFPSFNAHRVTPVISGVRYSLVAWISGNPFR